AEARHPAASREPSYESMPPPAPVEPREPATDQRTLAMERRVRFLETRLAELERELEQARAQLSVDVDLSDVGSPAVKDVPDDDPAERARRARADPRDDEPLHALCRVSSK